jgi:hypothetical protein
MLDDFSEWVRARLFGRPPRNEAAGHPQPSGAV